MEKNRNSFVKQASILAMAGIIARFLGFIYRPILNAMIGDEGVGIYNLGYTVYNFFLILSSAGLPVAISKLVSEKIALRQYKAAHQIFKVSLMVALIFGFICSLTLWFGADYISELILAPRVRLTLLTLAPTVFMVAIMAVFRGYFQGLNNTIPTALSQIVEQFFNVIATLYLANLLMNSATLDPKASGAAGGTAGTGVGAIFGLIVLFGIYFIARGDILGRVNRDKTGEPLPTNSKVAKILISIAVPIILGSAIFSISGLIDSAMMTRRLTVDNNINFSNQEATALIGRLTGKFYAITTLPISISTALAVAAIPSISGSHSRKDKKAVNAKINSALKISMILSIPAAVGIGVLAEPILLLIFPANPLGKELFYVGFVSIILLSLAQIITGMLQAIGKVQIPVIAAFLGTIVKIPINYFLLADKNINIQGAVISTIACYFVVVCFNWRFLCKYTKTRPDFMTIIIKPCISAFAMALSVFVTYNVTHYIIKSNTISLFVSVVIGMLTYFIYMLIIKGLNQKDLGSLPIVKKFVPYFKKMGII